MLAPFLYVHVCTKPISAEYNDEPLTAEELAGDCLCYLTHEGKPVKAARFFGGYEHEIGVQKIAADYGVPVDFYKKSNPNGEGVGYMDFYNAMEAYSKLMQQLVAKQVFALELIMTGNITKIFVDGGFSKNEIFMTLLAEAYPKHEVYVATVAQASALGAAVVVHNIWNNKPLPKELINVKRHFAR